jgi:hypothetical protein
VVFAAQAKVPPERTDREAILLALADVRPPGSAVVKVPATAGEQQTHHEELPYADLWASLSAAGRAFSPDPTWLLDNYFHPVGEDDLVPRVTELVRRRDAGRLPLRSRGRRPSWRRQRETARLLLPGSVLRLVRLLRRILSGLRVSRRPPTTGR